MVTIGFPLVDQLYWEKFSQHSATKICLLSLTSTISKITANLCRLGSNAIILSSLRVSPEFKSTGPPFWTSREGLHLRRIPQAVAMAIVAEMVPPPSLTFLR